MPYVQKSKLKKTSYTEQDLVEGLDSKVKLLTDVSYIMPKRLNNCDPKHSSFTEP